MPQCSNCYKPLVAPGLCRPCNEEQIAAAGFFGFDDEDEVTEVTGSPATPQWHGPQDPWLPEETTPTYCTDCQGTGDWGKGNSLIGCPTCQGTGYIH
jgi:hypothetical protein